MSEDFLRRRQIGSFHLIPMVRLPSDSLVLPIPGSPLQRIARDFDVLQ
jgi:hypothetical protein